ncbi:Periplasmic nitrate reductase [Streptomyces griseoloalbus]
MVSAPRAAHIEERIRSLDFLAVCDVVLSETAELADVVLPVTQWAEETGTTADLEGRVLLRRRAVTPPPDVRGDLEVLHELAARLGGEGSPESVSRPTPRRSSRSCGGRARAARRTTRGSPTGGWRRRTGCSGPAPPP